MNHIYIYIYYSMNEYVFFVVVLLYFMGASSFKKGQQRPGHTPRNIIITTTPADGPGFLGFHYFAVCSSTVKVYVLCIYIFFWFSLQRVVLLVGCHNKIGEGRQLMDSPSHCG
jgi:hypothetical protein